MVWQFQGPALRERDVPSMPEHWKAEDVLSHLSYSEKGANRALKHAIKQSQFTSCTYEREVRFFKASVILGL